MMRRLLTAEHLVALHLLLSAGVLAWNLYITGRIAQWREAPRGVATLSGLAGLLIAPALLLAVVSSSLLTGRALSSLSWVWPATTTLTAVQAVYATARGRVAPALGAPIALYDVLVAAAATTRYLEWLGLAVPAPALALTAAQGSVLSAVAHPDAMRIAWLLLVPALAPAVPTRRRGLRLVVRGGVALVAGAWGALMIIALPQALRAVESYRRYAGARLQERPQGDFVIGLKLFPTLRAGGPPSLSVDEDRELLRRLDAQAVSVYVAHGGVTDALLDSLGRSLDEERRAGKRLIIALGGSASPLRRQSFTTADAAARVADVERIARRLRPEMIVPDVGRHGSWYAIPVTRWVRFLGAAAAAAHRAAPATRVMVRVDPYGWRDSALYAWAARAASPVDYVGFAISPGIAGAATLDARLATADRWMRLARSPKRHYVLEAGGLPASHGEGSQARALWGALAWATSRSAVKGLVVFEASDYEAPVGLRAAGGRLRPATATAERAIRAMSETGQ